MATIIRTEPYTLDSMESIQAELNLTDEQGIHPSYKVTVDGVWPRITQNNDPTNFGEIYRFIDPDRTLYIDIDIYDSNNKAKRIVLYFPDRYTPPPTSFPKVGGTASLAGFAPSPLYKDSFVEAVEEATAKRMYQFEHNNLKGNHDRISKELAEREDELLEAYAEIDELKAQLDAFSQKKFHYGNTNVAELLGMLGMGFAKGNPSVIRKIPLVGPLLAAAIESQNDEETTGNFAAQTLPGIEEGTIEPLPFENGIEHAPVSGFKGSQAYDKAFQAFLDFEQAAGQEGMDKLFEIIELFQTDPSIIAPAYEYTTKIWFDAAEGNQSETQKAPFPEEPQVGMKDEY